MPDHKEHGFLSELHRSEWFDLNVHTIPVFSNFIAFAIMYSGNELVTILHTDFLPLHCLTQKSQNYSSRNYSKSANASKKRPAKALGLSSKKLFQSPDALLKEAEMLLLHNILFYSDRPPVFWHDERDEHKTYFLTLHQVRVNITTFKFPKETCPKWDNSVRKRCRIEIKKPLVLFS